MTYKIKWPKCIVCGSLEVWSCPVCGVFACKDHTLISPDGEHCEHVVEARSEPWQTQDSVYASTQS